MRRFLFHAYSHKAWRICRFIYLFLPTCRWLSWAGSHSWCSSCTDATWALVLVGGTGSQLSSAQLSSAQLSSAGTAAAASGPLHMLLWFHVSSVIFGCRVGMVVLFLAGLWQLCIVRGEGRRASSPSEWPAFSCMLASSQEFHSAAAHQGRSRTQCAGGPTPFQRRRCRGETLPGARGGALCDL
jgi:hypothetical protein